MKKFNLRSGLLATTTIAGALATTAGVTALVSTVATLAPSAAEAQDYTSGAIVGTVTDASGKPVSGASVTMVSKAQGQTRTLSTDASGQFRMSQMAPGDYSVTVKAPGYTDYSGVATIVVDQEVRFGVAMSMTGQPQTVVVKGHRVAQDFTKTATGLNVDLETLAAQEPIARSITAVTMLAPTTVQGVSGFGDVPSIGGASVAENAYYINGLNITNPDTYVGGAGVPFDFYKTVQVETGGYQAEFGRATGGIINATTKSGSNEFKMVLHGNFQPKNLESYAPDTTNYKGKSVSNDTESASVELSGPIIKDHLFFYGLYQSNDNTYTAGGFSSTNYSVAKEMKPFVGGKIDGYITPKQHLELTYFDTTQVENTTNYNWDPSTLTRGAMKANAGSVTNSGGKNWVAKYTGNVTDWFVVSAAYGDSKDSGDVMPQSNAYYVANYFNGASPPAIVSSQQNTSTFSDDTERKFYRADGDIRFDAWGHHHVRFGLDHEDLSMIKTTTAPGAVPLLYRINRPYTNPTTHVAEPELQIIYEKLGGNVSGKDSAYYIEDSWDVTHKLNLQIGFRDDLFQQNNLSGQKYLDLKNNWGPRLGFSYEPTGSSDWKVYGSFGQYYIPPAMNLGYRGKDTYFAEYFHAPAGGWTYDANNLPTAIGAADTTHAGYDTKCPLDISAGPGHPVNGTDTCTVFGAGVQDPAFAKTAPNLHATQESEFILGTTWKPNDLWTLDVSYTYRNLEHVSEDSDFSSNIYSYYNCGTASQKASDQASCDFYGANSTYYVWNPGQTNLTLVDWTDKTKMIHLTGLQFPKPKREYRALVLDWKRAFDGKWGLQGSLTLSRSYGNYEGTVKSDAGNSAQTDAGSNQDFDYLHLTDYSTGLLPNHRGYEFKTFGEYAITDAFLVGANVTVTSPYHEACQGIYPGGGTEAGYGAATFYCHGQPSPRGSSFTTDWEKNIDLSLRYTVPSKYALAGKLILRADIFNLLASEAVIQRYAQGDATSPSNPDPNYLKPLYYQAPRSIRIGFDLSY